MFLFRTSRCVKMSSGVAWVSKFLFSFPRVKRCTRRLMTKLQNERGNLTYTELHRLVSGLKKASGQLREFSNDNDAAAFQLNVFGGLFLDSSSFTPSETFEAILNKVRQAIRYDDPDQKVTLSNYQSAKNDVFEPFNAERRYLIGNFVRAQMLATPSIFNLNNKSAKNQLHKISTKTVTRVHKNHHTLRLRETPIPI